jgi:Na+/H+ antiporter NhaA
MTTPIPPRRVPSALRDFLRSEAAGGILLIAAATLAMIVANSPFATAYFDGLHMKLGPMSLHHWINDGLMALFFLLVGLEIKREFVDGHLSTWEDRGLPIIAAVGGMAVPAMIFLAVAGGIPPTSPLRSAYSRCSADARPPRSSCFSRQWRSWTTWAPSRSSRWPIPPA